MRIVISMKFEWKFMCFTFELYVLVLLLWFLDVFECASVENRPKRNKIATITTQLAASCVRACVHFYLGSLSVWRLRRRRWWRPLCCLCYLIIPPIVFFRFLAEWKRVSKSKEKSNINAHRRSSTSPQTLPHIHQPTNRPIDRKLETQCMWIKIDWKNEKEKAPNRAARMRGKSVRRINQTNIRIHDINWQYTPNILLTYFMWWYVCNMYTMMVWWRRLSHRNQIKSTYMIQTNEREG